MEETNPAVDVSQVMSTWSVVVPVKTRYHQSDQMMRVEEFGHE